LRLSRTITVGTPILTGGPMQGHPWCAVFHSVRLVDKNGWGAHGLVHGHRSLNVTSIHRGRMNARPTELAKELRNGHLESLAFRRQLPVREGKRCIGSKLEWLFVLRVD